MPKKAQIDKFREKARELDTDEDEGRFDEALRRIAKAKAGDPATLGLSEAQAEAPAPLKEAMKANSRALEKLLTS